MSAFPPGQSTSNYVGRFAPSPTGPLHFGSLLGALASFLDARAHGGQWLVRIEDIDPPREQPGAAAAILQCLRAHGLVWDGDVLYQSSRTAAYRAALDQLLRSGAAFFCTCSRAELAGSGGIYPGRCRGCTREPTSAHAVRLQVDARDIAFSDAIQGTVRQNLAVEVGDFVIFRKENQAAYQLAVVVDDAAQGVTDVVRGSDLLDSTARQIFLQQCLSVDTPRYAHIPVIANTAGQKLSKQTFAPALDNSAAAANLCAALEFLGQTAPVSRAPVAAILAWAIAHWDMARIPGRRSVQGEELPASCRAFAV